MEQTCACGGCGDVGRNTVSVAEGIRYMAEYLLVHVVMRADIEHVDGTETVKCQIKYCRGPAAHKI